MGDVVLSPADFSIYSCRSYTCIFLLCFSLSDNLSPKKSCQQFAHKIETHILLWWQFRKCGLLHNDNIMCYKTTRRLMLK